MPFDFLPERPGASPVRFGYRQITSRQVEPVIALMRWNKEWNNGGDSFDTHINSREPAGSRLNPVINQSGVQRTEPSAVFIQVEEPDATAVFRPESGVEELGTELVEAMSHVVVCNVTDDQMPAGPHHPEAAIEGLGKIKDVLEGSAIHKAIEAVH